MTPFETPFDEVQLTLDDIVNDCSLTAPLRKIGLRCAGGCDACKKAGVSIVRKLKMPFIEHMHARGVSVVEESAEDKAMAMFYKFNFAETVIDKVTDDNFMAEFYKFDKAIEEHKPKEMIAVAGPTGKFRINGKIVKYVDGKVVEEEPDAILYHYILDKVMDKQKKFQQLLGNDVTTKEFTKEMFLGLHCETSEALQELSWKNWKKHGDDNMDNFLEEMADIFLFYTNILLSKSISFTSLLAAVHKKQEKNLKRQEVGY